MRTLVLIFTLLPLYLSIPASADNLLDIYQAAVKNDPAMKTAQAELDARQAAAKVQRGALLPTIGARVEAGYTDQESSAVYTDGSTRSDNGNCGISICNPGFETLTGDAGTTTSLQLSLSQPLLDMTKWYLFKSSNTLSEEAEIKFRKDQQTLIKRTVEAYLNVLKAHEDLATSIAEETAIKQQLDQTQQRFDVGLVAITDVHESQAAYDLAKVTRISNEGSLQVAYELLTLLTDQKHDNLNRLSDNFPITLPEPNDMDHWVQQAMTNSPKIAQAEKAKQAAEYAVKSVRAGHYPVISLETSYSKNEADGDRNSLLGGDLYESNNVEGESESTYIGVRLDVPLFAGGAVYYAGKQASADYQKALEALASTKRSVTQETRARYIALLTQKQQVAARKQSITSAQSALEAIQAGYDVGTRNILDILNAQKTLFRSKRDYAHARYDYIINYFRLKESIGNLTPDDIQSLNQWLAVIPDKENNTNS